MKLKYDPAENENFWAEIRQLPGFPEGEVIPLRQMLFEPGALFKLPAVLKNLPVPIQAPLLVVMDPTVMRRGDEALKPLVLQTLRKAGWQVEPLVLQPGEDGQVHPAMQQVETVKARLGQESAVVSVGSGVVTDITKHACYLFEQETGAHIPFTVYQTANSVSAYTSNGAPLFVQGVKRTFHSRYPDALVCDLETLRDAPQEMTISGVGDLLAIYVSLPDWYLAHKLGVDPNYTEIPQDLMGPLDQLIYRNLEEIRSGSLEGMALLAKLITLGGIAMSVSHSTAPLSGYEHLVSHILDLQNEQAGQALPLHGTQVALATFVCASAYEQFIHDFDPVKVSPINFIPNEEVIERRILQSYQLVDPSGKAGAECWSDYRKKLQKWNTVSQEVEKFLKAWPEVREELAGRTRPAQHLKDLFGAAGGPKNFAELQPPAGEAQVKFAFFNSPYMRNRFTLGDLLVFLNWDWEKLWGQIWQETQAG